MKDGDIPDPTEGMPETIDPATLQPEAFQDFPTDAERRERRERAAAQAVDEPPKDQRGPRPAGPRPASPRSASPRPASPRPASAPGEPTGSGEQNADRPPRQ